MGTQVRKTSTLGSLFGTIANMVKDERPDQPLVKTKFTIAVEARLVDALGMADWISLFLLIADRFACCLSHSRILVRDSSRPDLTTLTRFYLLSDSTPTHFAQLLQITGQNHV